MDRFDKLGRSVVAMTDIAYLTPDGDIVVVGFVAWKRASFVDEDRAIPDSWQRLIAVPVDAPVATVDTRDVLVATNYRPLSEVIAEWRADPEKAAMMDRHRDDARAYFRDHPALISEIKCKS